MFSKTKKKKKTIDKMSKNGITRISGRIETDNIISPQIDNINAKNTEQDERLDTLESNQITLTVINNEHINYNISGTASFENNIFTFVFDEQPTTGTITFEGEYYDGMLTYTATFTIYFGNGAYTNMQVDHSGGTFTDVLGGSYDSSTLTFKMKSNNGRSSLNSFDESTLSINMPNEKVITHTQDTKSLNILSDDLTDNNIYSASKILDIIYPIGSIYLTFVKSPPVIGTWELLSSDYFLRSTTTTSARYGGSATHTHTTANHTLTESEMPAHIHGLKGYGATLGSGSTGWRFGGNGSKLATDVITSTGGSQPHNHGNTGSSSNIPPFITCYMYKRIA